MRRYTFSCLACVLLVGGCSSTTAADSLARGEAAPPGAGTDPNAQAPGEAPREKEIESDYEAPVATGNFVWITNPKSGRVAYVDAVTLQVRTTEAGNGPTYLASVPAQADDTTIVLNVLSEDATILRATKSGIIAAKTLKTAPQLNTLSFSEDGHYAIAWSDVRKVANAAKTDGYQDLTVLDLAAGKSFTLAVGYRPVNVGFAAGKLRAHAITQDGVAIIDLSGANPIVTKNVAMSDTPNEDPGTRDVFVTKDGVSAFIRRDGSPDITIVNLETNARSKVTLSGNVTDMDLTDGGDRAIAIVRDTAQVAVMPVNAPQTFQSTTVTGETIGSVSLAPGGGKALLYTNAINGVERFTVFDIGQASFRTVKLYSQVLGIFSSPDAQHAVVLHDKTDGVNGSPGAFSVVPIGQALPAKIVSTKAPPSAVAMQNDRAVIAERSKTIFGAYLARTPSLMVERYALASPPSAVGVVPSARRAYISQEHPEGRITFVDLDTGVARTLTGFELSSRVVDGSKP